MAFYSKDFTQVAKAVHTTYVTTCPPLVLLVYINLNKHIAYKMSWLKALYINNTYDRHISYFFVKGVSKIGKAVQELYVQGQLLKEDFLC